MGHYNLLSIYSGSCHRLRANVKNIGLDIFLTKATKAIISLPEIKLIIIHYLWHYKYDYDLTRILVMTLFLLRR